MWLKNPRMQRLVGRWNCLMDWAVDAVAVWQFVALRGHKDPETVAFIRRIRKERYSLCTPFEAWLVFSLAQAQSRLEGDMAEVGVFAGATAKLLCEAKGPRRLHLFDTFAGLPEPSDFEKQVHTKNQFACSLDSVQAYLASYPNVNYHAGRFPDTAEPLNGVRLSFAHFDVDLYESTLACLEFFYPRMVPGGIMLSHDYSMLAGVKKAFDEFLADKPEQAIELPTTQCMIVKR